MALLVRPTFKVNGKEEKIKNMYLYVIANFREDGTPLRVWQYYLGDDGVGYHSDKQNKGRLMFANTYWFYLSKEKLKSPTSKIKEDDCMGPIDVENKKEQEVILDPQFELELHLDNFDDNHFTPYCFDNNSLDKSMIKFEYELKSETEGDDFVADETCFTINKDGSEVFKGKFTKSEHEDSKFLKLGKHTFEWDGYDNSDKLDTTVFTEKGLSFEVLVKKAGKEVKKDFTFTVERGDTTHTRIGQYYNAAGYSYSGSVSNDTVEWIDLTIDRANKKIEVFIAIDFQNEKNLQSTTYPTFSDLKSLAETGIKKYWSRDVDINAVKYKVVTNIENRDTNCIDVDLYLNTDEDEDYSHNSGIIDASVVYNKGLFDKFRPRTARVDADNEYQFLAAHEFGHSVLELFGGKKFSWKHKGTTTFLTQNPLDKAPTYRLIGEIDLMYYFSNGRPNTFYNRVIAAEEDVKRLMALYSVEFDED